MPETADRDLLKGLALGVLYGGPSAERPISLDSGKNVAQALSLAGHDVHRVVLDGSFTAKDAGALGIDLAFLALHGEFGEDGRIQGILEAAEIPYTGSGVDASSMAFDKIVAKRIFERRSIRTPAWMSLDVAEMSAPGALEGLYLVPPLVAKPATGGSSLGVSIVRDAEQVRSALTKASEYADSVLIERYIPGRELTVGVLGETALPVAEIVKLKAGCDFYDYSAKYSEGTSILCPAELEPAVAEKVQALALAAHRALGCRDVSRTDIILDAAGTPWVLEVNTLPGLTSHSLLPRAANAAGIGFTQLCERLLCLALRRALVGAAAGGA
jgi:D-alanine-D-alanine ligase